jgi:ABC-type sugar transport system ATPase subunit
VLSVDRVEQEYPGVHALKGVSLSVERGQILGLVGENGAGKSTLIRILAGIEVRAAGQIVFKGDEVSFANAAESQKAGISVVSQEFRLIPQLSVADNIFLRQELSRRGVIRRAETRRRTQELLDMLELPIDPGQLVSTLPMADQQMVEIARAFSREFDLLIMDEPTAALNEPEVDRLLSIVRKLAESGKAVIYVSHHLDEVFRVCDTVVVFRDGNSVWSGPTSELTEASLVELMLGRKPETFGASPDRTQANVGGAQSPALRLSRVSVGGVHVPLDMYVMPGEVVGFAGLAGSGRVELMRALSGDTRLLSGRVLVKGKEAALTSPHSAIASGLFSLGEDRKQEGILPHLDVTENTMISRRRKLLRGAERFMTLPAVELAQFDRLRQRMNIKVPNGRVLIGNLSGGNQQKAMLGRAASTQCGVLLLNEPTRGVDVGAKVEIYKLIRLLADDGAAVVVSSSDVPELVALVDRCVVFCDGRVVAELSRPNITENTIVAASLGQDLVEVAHA